MGKFLVWVFILLALGGGAYYFYSKNGNSFDGLNPLSGKNGISISSQEFAKGGVIPTLYTCDGDNINPPLVIDRVPGDAKSLVLIVEDMDSKPEGFTHLIIYNLSPETLNIESGNLSAEASYGINDYGEIGYDGPCPPQNENHKYYFRIYAIGERLPNDKNLNRKDIEEAIRGKIIKEGEFYGQYLNRFNPR